MKLELLNLSGKSVGSLEADDKVFGLPQNKEVVYQTLRWFLASKRAGTHSTLTRAEVSGGGKKPWKQKGTGNARAGSIRSPLWRHGGVTFGPKPRDYSYNLPRKIRNLALKVVLSDRVKNGSAVVLDAIELSSIKTKEVTKILDKLSLVGKVLIVDLKPSKELVLSTRNIANVTVVNCESLNIHQLLNSNKVVLTKAAIEGLKEMLG